MITSTVFYLLGLSCVLRQTSATDAGTTRKDFIALTVATEETDGYKRFMRSAKEFDISVEVLGMGKEWKGGDTRRYAGGGQKVGLLRERLELLKDKKDLIIMFTDAYDVILNDEADEIIARFKKQFPDARIVFSAESFCWPDQSLAPKYPLVRRGKRYLNSGMFIGYAPELYQLVSTESIADGDDDQLFYTKVYLNDEQRKSLKLELDSESYIFQNMYGAMLDLEMIFRKPEKAEVHNIAYDTYPVVIHGNGLSKIDINSYGNYIGNYFNLGENGCVACRYDRLDISSKSDTDLPQITLALFIPGPTAFLEEYLEHVKDLDYPKLNMDLFVWLAHDYHAGLIDKWVDKNGANYKSVKYHKPSELLKEKQARALAADLADLKDSDYLMIIDSSAHLTNPKTIKLLMDMNRDIIAPMVGRPKKLWTNFWGALNENGFYGRSNDYQAIATYERKGVWNVPFISQAMLIKKRGNVFERLQNAYYYDDQLDAEMSLAKYARDSGIFMYVDNQHPYGNSIISDEFDITKNTPDLYMLFDNREEWEERYLHPKYYDQLEPEYELEEPCPDVYDFAWFTKRFCQEFIDEMEHFGKWSSGTNQDERLEGGYENVPTRDIHMKQVDYERHWLFILDEYVRPLQEKVYIGYYHSPIESTMMFVVRYKPDEQAELRPHHDASTYSIDLALNERGKDFQGGGVRFTRYNCSVLDHEVGYSLLFPGRLTHQHEGLRTTGGTRYIGVSFINP